MQEKGERNLGHKKRKPRNHVKTEAEFQVILTQDTELQETPEARRGKKGFYPSDM